MINLNYATNASLAQDLKIQFKCEIKEEKLTQLTNNIKKIQQSIGWDAMDLRIAQRRLHNHADPKITIKQAGTKELLAYAILTPQASNQWYLSQIAVSADQQGRGLGKMVMNKIFEEARLQNISQISLETEGKVTNFYQSFNSDAVRVESEVTGRNRFGEPKITFKYILAPT